MLEIDRQTAPSDLGKADRRSNLSQTDVQSGSLPKGLRVEVSQGFSMHEGMCGVEILTKQSRFGSVTVFGFSVS